MRPKSPYPHENHPGCHQRVHSFYVLLISSSGRLITSNRGGLLFFYIAFREDCGSRELDKTLKLQEYQPILFFFFFLECVVFFPALFVMTNFQYYCIALDSGMFRCLSVLTHAVCIAPERHSCQELHRVEQNRTTFVVCFGEWRVCIVFLSERRGVSGFNQYLK